MSELQKPGRGTGRAAALAFSMTLAAVILTVTGCGGGGNARTGGVPVASLSMLAEPGAAAGMNVLLVTLDTVRSDRLGCYGYELAETPTLDALARHAVLFEDAVAPAPITLPSHATMLTGLYPPNHGVRDNGLFVLDPRHQTLTETLSDEGYETAAFISSFVLDARYGLDQGFGLYEFAVTRPPGTPAGAVVDRRDAAAVTDAAIGWLRERSSRRDVRPFFAWVHYYDPHIPYGSPYSRLERFRERPYDGEIAYVDLHLARLVDELDAQGLTDETLIVVVSDHGEGLGEHGENTHGVLLHEATMRVAFYLSCPALFDAAYRIGDGVVSLVDLRPTLEQLLGLPVTAPVDGMGLVTETPSPERAVYIETMLPYFSAQASPLTGMRRHLDKLVQGPTPEYYDLTADPDELENRYASAGDAVEELTRALREINSTFDETTPSGLRIVSPEEAERLRSLGYMSASASGQGATLPDASAVLRAQALMGEAFGHMRAGRQAEALRANEAARQLCGLFKDTVLQQMIILEQMGRQEEAVRAAGDFLERRPDAEVALAQARLLMNLRRFEEMEKALAVAASADPGNGFVNIVRGDRFCLEGRLSDAMREYEQAIRIDGERLRPLVEPQMASVREAMRGARR